MGSQISLCRHTLQRRKAQHPAPVPPHQPEYDAITQATLAVEKQHRPRKVEIVVRDHRNVTVPIVRKSHPKESLHHKLT